MAAYRRRAEQQLDRNGSLARAGGSVTGLDGQAVPLTEAGLVAAAHRRGAGSVARYLAHRTSTPDAPLSQAERSGALQALRDQRARVCVATDVAARGLDLPDLDLVVHADSPGSRETLLHRSGRTARAGNEGTVVTLMTSEQVRDVRALTKAAGITPTITRLSTPSHPVLADLAPGERSRPGGLVVEAAAAPARANGGGAGGGL